MLLHLRQRTEARERRSIDEIAAHFGVSPERCQVIKSTFLADRAGSALTDPAIDVPLPTESNDVPITYLSFRNAHLLYQAVSWEEVIDARAVFSPRRRRRQTKPLAHSRIIDLYQHYPGTKQEMTIRN